MKLKNQFFEKCIKKHKEHFVKQKNSEDPKTDISGEICTITILTLIGSKRRSKMKYNFVENPKED